MISNEQFRNNNNSRAWGRMSHFVHIVHLKQKYAVGEWKGAIFALLLGVAFRCYCQSEKGLPLLHYYYFFKCVSAPPPPPQRAILGCGMGGYCFYLSPKSDSALFCLLQYLKCQNKQNPSALLLQVPDRDGNFPACSRLKC